MDSAQTPSKLTASPWLQGGPPSLLQAVTGIQAEIQKLRERQAQYCASPKGRALPLLLKPRQKEKQHGYRWGPRGKSVLKQAVQGQKGLSLPHPEAPASQISPQQQLVLEAPRHSSIPSLSQYSPPTCSGWLVAWWLT